MTISEILLFFFLQIINIFAESNNTTISTPIHDIGTSYLTITSYIFGILVLIIIGFFAYIKRKTLTSYFN